MDKREEIISELNHYRCSNCGHERCEVCSPILADKALSIANRIPCPACNTGWKKPLLCDCKDGWIYPDPQKMYEALKKIINIVEMRRENKFHCDTNLIQVEKIANLAIKGEG